MRIPHRHGIYLIGIGTSLFVISTLLGHSELPKPQIPGQMFPGESKALKTIYLWNPGPSPRDLHTSEEEKDSLSFFKVKDTNYPYKPPPCPVRCRYTTKPKFLRTADAVVFFRFELVFHLNKTSSRRPLPPDQRQAHQLYIYFDMEPPNKAYEEALRKHPLSKGFFDHTMSYRQDSSIHLPYYEVVRARREPQNYFPDMSKKRKFAAWMVSNCYARSKRHLLVRKLRSYVPLNIYGKCSQVVWPCGSALDDECYRILGKTHKFYLSFENSLCEDYVTEKFFLALKSDMIPVVYGQANYSGLAPPKSFINAREFPTVRDLARYLKRLDQNETEYLEYLKWKKDWEVSALSGWEDPYCILCQKLTSGDLAKKSSVIEDAGTWWTRGQDGRSHACKQAPSQFL